MPTNCAQLIKKHEMLLEEYGKARVRIADLESALKPFASDYYAESDDDDNEEVFVKIGDLRAARAALRSK